ncbi:MAG: methionine--tRNA ligase, partial [Actinomycetota bacterium]|nr:methionine--tRNA ligase [Actinomycetota bacterium]
KSAISPSTGRTLPDRYIEGTCPICGYHGARGDQCDNCGNQLDPTDLINPRSKINGETPSFIDSEQYMLDLPALSTALGDWLHTRADWRPNVLKFSLNLLDDIKPRAMTRDIDWGIPVPLAGWRDRPDKKLYVWFDAVIGYLSASIEWARRFGGNGQPDPDAWQHWWANPDAQHRYFMGKDNITFHSQIWPAELLAYNGEGKSGGSPGQLGHLDLPTEVVSSEFLTMSGSKLSTSRGTVIYVGDFLREYGPDALRYFVAVAGPESQDTDFTWEEFVRRTNFELANEWGNLVNRSISMAHKNFGAIPQRGTLMDVDAQLLATAERGFETVGELLGRSRFRQASSEAMRVVSAANKYISDTEPWKISRDTGQTGRLATVLNTALQVVDDAKTLLTPFLPHSSQKVFEALGGQGIWAAEPEIRIVTDFDDEVEGTGPQVADYPVLTGDWAAQQAVWRRRDIEPGTPLNKPIPLFTKLDPGLGETGPDWAPIAAD